jgi:hypothetical protein
MQSGTENRFRIEPLEERVAPVVHPLVPVFANGAFAASGGNAAGTNAEAANVNCPDCGGPLGSEGHPVGLVAPVFNPGNGFTSIGDFPETGRGIP